MRVPLLYRKTCAATHWEISFPVYLFAIPNPHDENAQDTILDAADNPIVTNPVLPGLSQSGAFERFTSTARIDQYGHTFTQKTVKRQAICLSSFTRLFLEASSNLIRQTKAALHFLYTVGLAAACPNFNRTVFCKVQIFEVVQILKDSFASVKGLGASRELCQCFKTCFNFYWQSNCKHDSLLFCLCYTGITHIAADLPSTSKKFHMRKKLIRPEFCGGHRHLQYSPAMTRRFSPYPLTAKPVHGIPCCADIPGRKNPARCQVTREFRSRMPCWHKPSAKLLREMRDEKF